MRYTSASSDARANGHSSPPPFRKKTSLAGIAVLLAAMAVFMVPAYAWCASFRAEFESLLAKRVASDILRTRVSFAAQPIHLLFVGDIMLGRAVAKIFERNGGPDFAFKEVIGTLRQADLVFGNLEGPISERGQNQGSIYSFRFDPAVTGALARAGFRVLSVANNHIWDYGREALLDTLDHLRQNGIQPVGAGKDEAEANRPVKLTVKGNRLAFLAYTDLYPRLLAATTSTPGISRFDLEEIGETIKEIRNNSDLVVVSLHFGEEYKMSSGSREQAIARKLIDAGADLIVGHHPHVVQELEEYRRGWIAYSLGNFVFDQNFSLETLRGGALCVYLDKGQIKKVDLNPVNVSGLTYQPEIKCVSAGVLCSCGSQTI